MIFRFHSYNENVQQARSVLNSVKKDETNLSYKKIRKMLTGYDGYVGLFTKLHFLKKVSLRSLTTLKDIIIDQPNLIRNLPKNLIEYDDYENIVDDIERVKVKIEAKKMYNEFPSEQKGFMDINDDKDIDMLYLLSQRKDKSNFLRKISAYHNRPSLVNRLNSFLNSDSSASYDKIISDVGSNRAKIITASKEDSLIICQIDQYNQCRSLGSDTSWCIARDSGTFRSYVPNDMSLQYIIYFTDKEPTDNDRKIGVTYNIGGFMTAHNVRDAHISPDKLGKLLNEYGFDINRLKLSKDKVKDFNPASVKDLLNIGFTMHEIIDKKVDYKIDDLKLLDRDIIIERNLINKIDPDRCTVKNLLDVGFTIKEILDTKKVFIASDLDGVPKSLIDKYDLINKTQINGSLLKEYDGPEIEKRNMFERVKTGSLTINDIMHIPPRIINANRDIIISKLFNNNDENSERKIFIDNFTKPKSELTSLYDYSVGSRWSDKNKYSLDRTIYKLKFYMVGPYDYDFNDFVKSGVFTDAHNSDLIKIKEYFDLNGFKYTNEQITNYFDKITKHFSFGTKVSFYSNLMEIGIDCKKEFKKYIDDSNVDWTKYDLAKIEEYFTKEELEKFYENFDKTRFVNDLSTCCIMHRSDKKKSIKPEDFYTQWNNYIKTKNIPSGSDGQLHVGLIAIYASIGKLDELDRIDFHWKSKEFVHNLAKYLCDQWFFNSTPHIGLKLTDEQKKSVYIWIKRNHMTPILYDLVDHFNEGRLKDYQLQVLYFLYDKEEFQDYLDRLKDVRNNNYYSSGHDTKNYFTIRINGLIALINYLKKNKRYDDIKEVISNVLKWPMSKDEAKRTKIFMYEKLDGDSNYTSDIDIYKANFKEFVEAFRPDITDYIRKKSNNW